MGIQKNPVMVSKSSENCVLAKYIFHFIGPTSKKCSNFQAMPFVVCLFFIDFTAYSTFRRRSDVLLTDICGKKGWGNIRKCVFNDCRTRKEKVSTCNLLNDVPAIACFHARRTYVIPINTDDNGWLRWFMKYACIKSYPSKDWQSMHVYYMCNNGIRYVRLEHVVCFNGYNLKMSKFPKWLLE